MHVQYAIRCRLDDEAPGVVVGQNAAAALVLAAALATEKWTPPVYVPQPVAYGVERCSHGKERGSLEVHPSSLLCIVPPCGASSDNVHIVRWGCGPGW